MKRAEILTPMIDPDWFTEAGWGKVHLHGRPKPARGKKRVANGQRSGPVSQAEPTGNKYQFDAEDCPECGASMEGDPYSGKCNSCGHKWGTRVANYDPNQVRDKEGQWATSAGTGSIKLSTTHRDPQTGLHDRARVGVPAMMVPPPPKEIPRLPNLKKKQRAVESAFADAYLKDPDGMANKYLKALKGGRVGVAPNVFATDDVKMLNPDWNPSALKVGEKLDADTQKAMAKYNTAIHQTANALSKRAFVKYLDDVVSKYPAGDPRRSVLVTQGGCAAGKGSSLSRAEDPNSPYKDVIPTASKVGAVWDAAGEQNATENAWVLKECKARGIKAVFAYVYADPNDTWDAPDRGVIRRAERKGRMVDARLFADSYAEGARNMHEFHQKYKDDPAASFIFIDNRKKGAPKLMTGVPEAARSVDGEKVFAKAVKSLKASKDRLPKALVKGGLAGTKIWGPPQV